MPEDTYNAVLVDRRDVHDQLAIFHVAPADGPVPAFEPGQFTNVGLILPRDDGSPELVKRAFSIASPPHSTQAYELYVRHVDNGRFTDALWSLKPGAPVWLEKSQAFGHFTLADVPEGADVVFIGTGTGIGPFVSMLRTYAGKGRWRRAALIESVRLAEDLGYRSQIEELARRDETLRYVPTATREGSSSAWEGSRAHLQELLEPTRFEALAGFALDPATCRVLLCGNPAMIESIKLHLGERGFKPHFRRNPGQIHTERYW